MPNSQVLRRAAAVVTLFTLWFAIRYLHWSGAVLLLQFFEARGWAVALLGAGLAMVLRGGLLGLPARPIATAAWMGLLYLLVFQTRLLPWRAEPTLLFISTFLVAAVAGALFLLDAVFSFFPYAYRHPGLKSHWRPLAACAVFLAAVTALLYFLKPNLSRGWLPNWITRHFYVLTLLLPLGAGLARRRLGKEVRYVLGLAVTYTAWFLLSPLIKPFTWGPLFFLLTMPWLLVYVEELAGLWRGAKEEWRQAETRADGKGWARAAQWWSALRARFADRGQAAGTVSAWSAAARDNLRRAGADLQEGVLGFVRARPRAAGGAVAAVLVIALGWPLAKAIYKWTHVTVLEFTPEGMVDQRAAIRIRFSAEVKPRLGDLRRLDCFKIEPPLAGQYRQESPQTIAFFPTESLKPSTRYRVEFDGANVVSTAKSVQGRAATEFFTPLFRVDGARVYYNVDPITAQDMEVVGELNFNYPVALDVLRQHARITKDGQALPVQWERAIEPTRFYFRSEGVKPSAKPQEVAVFLAGALGCAGCTDPLKNDYRTTLSLPSKPKPQVTEVKLWHEPGQTLVSVMFNTPISREQALRHIAIEPHVPVDVQTEYAMAILRGPFKPNVGYTIRVRKGLVAKSGEMTETDYATGVRIQDLEPSVKFARNGNILALSGNQTLAVKTVNLDTVGVRVTKVFRNNLLAFLNNEYVATGKNVYDGFYRVEEGEINEELTQHINLAKFQAEPYKGLFQMELYDPKSPYNRVQGWFLSTDLGLVSKQSGDDLLVYVISVRSLKPVEGARVELVSDSNQSMDVQTTDGAGRAIFPRWKKHAYNLSPQFLTARKDDDFSFLSFLQAHKSAYQFAIGGPPFSRTGLEAFLTPERGVYRPGESAFVTAIVRTPDRDLPPDVPVQLVARDPRGAEHLRQDARLNANGLAVFRLDFSLSALTGAYDLSLEQPGQNRSLGHTQLKVEEFIPDKIKVDVAAPEKSVPGGAPLVFTVRARQLFGPPAADHKLTARVMFYSRIFSAKGYDDYVFQDTNRDFADETLELGEDKTDAKGEKTYSVAIPPLRPPSALRAYIYSEVFDSGGRPVSATGYADVDVYPHYLGLKRAESGPQRVGQAIRFRQVALDPAGKPVAAAKTRLVIRRKSWYSIFRRGNWGRSYYESSAYEEILVNEVKDLPAKVVEGSFTPEQEGEYTVLLVSPSGMRTSLVVNVLGTGYETTNLESPEKLHIVLDKERYNPGELAKVLVRAPFPGKLFLTVEREKVYETKIIELEGREATVTLEVKPEYLPNMYVVGLLVRAPSAKLDTLPMESFGVAPLEVRTDGRAIALDWDTAATAKSADGIDVSLRVSGPAGETNVVLAAVDEGILQITGFNTPNPLDFFYRKNGLTTNTYSIMRLLLPELEAKKFALGGGDAGEFTRRHLNPIVAKKKKSMAAFSGILTPGADGRVSWRVDTAGFNGEVRLMAMAVRGDRFGAAAKPVQVADPIVLQPSLPRFAAPGDEFQIPVQVYNKTGKAGRFTVVVKLEGPAKVMETTRQLDLPKDGQARIVFPAQAAADAGVVKVLVTARGNGEESRTAEELAIRPASHLVTVMKQGALSQNQTASIDVPKDFIPFGQKLRLAVSANPMFQYLGALDQLLNYPCGCAEQTASQAFPLLYLKDLGFATGRFAERANAVDERVQSAVDQLQKLQLANGYFSFWPGGRPGGRWLTYYISHFLIEADAKGYRVKPAVMGRIRTLLTTGVVEATLQDLEAEQGEGQNGEEGYDGEYSAPPQVSVSARQAADVLPSRLDRRGQEDQSALALDPYLLYLKALLGAPDRESMAVLAARKPETLGETSRALLSMAFSRIGDKTAALKVLTPTWKSQWLYREQFGDFNSPVRNTAMYLSALAQADPASPRVAEIVNYLGTQMGRGHFGSTQENAWALMALAHLYSGVNASVAADLTVDGKPYKTLEGPEVRVEDNALAGKKLDLKNLGEKKLYYHFLAEGTPLGKNEKSSSRGLTVSRTYRGVKGEAVNLTNVPQGELVVVTLNVSAEKEARNVVLVDLLPGGFEIENPRLRSRGELGFDPPGNFDAAYQDIRDDRLLLFTDGFMGARQFSYTVRAVTPGRYTVPNSYAEAMYDPDVNGEGAEPAPLTVADRVR